VNDPPNVTSTPDRFQRSEPAMMTPFTPFVRRGSAVRYAEPLSSELNALASRREAMYSALTWARVRTLASDG
jgi:hypothetical protein